MFQLRDQVHQQQVLNLTRGFLSFYDCTVKLDDVTALMQQVAHFARKGFPLRRVTFEFCRFHVDDGTLEQLQQFFANTESIRSIAMVKNSLSNEAMAYVLQGAQPTELIIVLPGGNTALHHRKALLEACQNRVESLFFDFKGASTFADLTESEVCVFQTLSHLKTLRLDGWTMNDKTFLQLVNGLQQITNLQALHLGRVRGLTFASLQAISKLGCIDNDNERIGNHQQRDILSTGLKELRISMIPFLFPIVDEHHSKNEQLLEEVFRNLRIREVVIQESKLDRRVVRAMFRGLAQNQKGLSTFRLKAWGFGEEEFQVLIRCLPQMTLSKFDLSQGGIDFSAREAEIVKALRTNVQITHLDLSYRGHTLNGSRQNVALAQLLQRNRNIQMVQHLLKRVPAGQDNVESLVLSKLAQHDASTTSNALFLLLNNRILTRPVSAHK